MKLTTEQVDKITALVMKTLKEQELIVFKADEERVLSRMREAFLTDLRAEDALDREVEEILNGHTGEIDSQRIDYRRMFNMIKGKLAREREIIL